MEIYTILFNLVSILDKNDKKKREYYDSVVE